MKNWKYIEGAKTGNETLAAHPDSAVAQEIYKIYLDNRKDKKKALEKLSGKYKNIPSDALEKHLDDAIKAYAQMIKNKNVTNEDKTGAEEFFKQLSDDVKEREEKDDADIEKVGNLSKDELLKELDVEEKLLKVLKERGGEKGYGTTPILYRDAKRRIQDLKNKLKQIGNKVGNSKWELPDGSTATVEDDGTIKIKKPRDSSIYITKLWDKERAEKQLAQKGAKKVGNAKDKNDKDLKVGDIVDVRGKKGKITKIIGDVIEVFYDNRGTYNPDRTDRHYADEATKVGNSKTGNVQYHKVGKITIKLEANDDDWTVYDTNGQELKSGKGGLGRAKTWAEHFARFTNKKAANSASDDKFAYVMREFDAGKLKTPDGKVVTDPAQAKAIAYSESKKTENGLARARKAMNAWNSERKIEPVGKYREFIRDLKNAIMLDVSAVTYNNVDEQTLKSWVEQAKKEGFGSAIKGVQGKKVILDVY